MSKQLTNLNTQQIYLLKYNWASTAPSTGSLTTFNGKQIGEAFFYVGNPFRYGEARHLFRPSSSNGVLNFRITLYNVNTGQVVYDDIQITEWQSPCSLDSSTTPGLCGVAEGQGIGTYQRAGANFDLCAEGCVRDRNCRTFAFAAYSELEGVCLYSPQRQQDMDIRPLEPDEFGEITDPSYKFYDRDCFTCSDEILPICAE